MPSRNYPRTVAEIVDDNMRYRRGAIAAVRTFKAAKPYRKDARTQLNLTVRLYETLSTVYEIPTPMVRFQNVHPNARRGNGVCQRLDAEGNCDITIIEKFSVITILHEFAHALGKDERQACRWSVNLFKRVWPRLYANASGQGHMLRSRRDAEHDAQAETTGRMRGGQAAEGTMSFIRAAIVDTFMGTNTRHGRR